MSWAHQTDHHRELAAYSATGGLLAGWPPCHVALIATPNDVAGVFAELFWLPAIHGMLLVLVLCLKTQKIIANT